VLDEMFTDARRGQLAGQHRTGATFAEVCHEFLHWIEFDRQRKRSTLDDYRSAVRAHLVPAFGLCRVEEITPARVDSWRSELVVEGRLSNRSVNKLLTILHGILERARKRFKLPATTTQSHPARTIPSDDPRVAHPIFTLREAAGYLGVPKSTMHQWARRSERPPLITVSPRQGQQATLPFIGFAEAYVLSAFRRSGVPLQRIRPAVDVLSREIGIEHALASQRLFADGAEMLFDYAEQVVLMKDDAIRRRPRNARR
jgi:hypothetical protein